MKSQPLHLHNSQLIVLMNTLYYALNNFYYNEMKANSCLTTSNIEKEIYKFIDFQFLITDMTNWLNLTDKLQIDYPDNKHSGKCTGENHQCLRCQYNKIRMACAMIFQTYSNKQITNYQDFFHYFIYAVIFSFALNTTNNIIEFAPIAFHLFKQKEKYPNVKNITKKLSEQVYKFIYELENKEK